MERIVVSAKFKVGKPRACAWCRNLAHIFPGPDDDMGRERCELGVIGFDEDDMRQFFSCCGWFEIDDSYRCYETEEARHVEAIG